MKCIWKLYTEIGFPILLGFGKLAKEDCQVAVVNIINNNKLALSLQVSHTCKST